MSDSTLQPPVGPAWPPEGSGQAPTGSGPAGLAGWGWLAGPENHENPEIPEIPEIFVKNHQK